MTTLLDKKRSCVRKRRGRSGASDQSEDRMENRTWKVCSKASRHDRPDAEKPVEFGAQNSLGQGRSGETTHTAVAQPHPG
jgi:hypothetical protein